MFSSSAGEVGALYCHIIHKNFKDALVIPTIRYPTLVPALAPSPEGRAEGRETWPFLPLRGLRPRGRG